jgi:hypothetical protein
MSYRKTKKKWIFDVSLRESPGKDAETLVKMKSTFRGSKCTVLFSLGKWIKGEILCCACVTFSISVVGNRLTN